MIRLIICACIVVFAFSAGKQGCNTVEDLEKTKIVREGNKRIDQISKEWLTPIKDKCDDNRCRKQ